MTRYLVKRLAQSLIAIIGVITIVFFIQRLAGDPVLLLVPEGASRQDIDTLRTQLGFDRPVIVQYAEYLAQLARFDLGRSIIRHTSVWTQLAPRIPYTLMLAGGALLVAVGIGLPIGIVIAMRRGTLIERALMSLVLGLLLSVSYTERNEIIRLISARRATRREQDDYIRQNA